MTESLNAILEEYAINPPNKYPMDDPSIRYKEKNRACAESMEVFLRIGDDGILEEFSFIGNTAIFTTAISSLFGESVIGMHTDTVLTLGYTYIRDLLSGEHIAMSRRHAATFALLATRNAIHEYFGDEIQDDFSDIFES